MKIAPSLLPIHALLRRAISRPLRLLPLALCLLPMIGLSPTARGQTEEAPSARPMVTSRDFIGALGNNPNEKSLHRSAPRVTTYILFRSGTAEIADAFSRRQLAEAGRAFSSPDLQGLRIEIGGHTDNVGSAESNLRLSRQRAATVKRFLCANYDIDPSQLEVVGYGEIYPVADNRSADGRAVNRRVVFSRLPAARSSDDRRR